MFEWTYRGAENAPDLPYYYVSREKTSRSEVGAATRSRPLRVAGFNG